MTSVSRLLAATIGRVSPRYRSLGQWAEIYRKIIDGKPLGMASLSARFEEAREAALPPFASGHPPSLHECRSLSERLYRKQGVNTMVLLGHSSQKMTDLYNDDRGLSSGEWKTLAL